MLNRSRVLRLSRYKNAVLRLKSLNFVRVFSDNLADATGVTAAQVRKDFSFFGIAGNRRGGYVVDELLAQLNKTLGKDQLHEFVLAGAGNIGKALMRYQGFEKSSIKITASFDIDPTKYNDKGLVPVYPLDKMHEFIIQHGIKLGIIAVPDYAAQQVLELMKSAGIKGILNFAPICLRESPDCFINSINLVTELENIIFFVESASQKGKK